MFAGIVAGPLSGALVGAAADLVGFAIWPSGPFVIWQITAISALNGVIPWAFVKLGWPRSRTARIWIGVTIARLALSVGWLPSGTAKRHEAPILARDAGSGGRQRRDDPRRQRSLWTCS